VLSIKEYQENVKPGSRKDALSTLLAAQTNDGSGLSHEEVIGSTLILIVGGELPFLLRVYLKALTLRPWL
jgi:cytochrome P450